MKPKNEVTLTRCGHDDADQGKVNLTARDQDHMVAHSDVSFLERDATMDQDQLT